jgi:O-antigen/teichoic acid export membrane protein
MALAKQLFIKSKKLLFNWLLIDQIIVSLFNFLIIIFLSRFLNIYDFGNYSGMFIVFLLLTSIQQAIFISPIFTLEVDINENNSFHRINEMRTVHVLFTIFLCFVFFIMSNIVMDLISIKINNLGFTFMLFFYLNNDFNRRVLIKLSKLKRVIFYDFVIYPCFFLSILLLKFSNNLSVDNIILSYCSISLIISVSLIWSIGLPLKIIYLDFKTLKKYWSFSKWILYSSLSQFITGNLFTVVASNQLGVSVYGIVRVFQGFSGIFNVFLQYIDTQSSLDLPNIFNKSGVYSCLKYCYKILLFSVIILLSIYSVAFVFGFDRIINLVFGEKYASYSYILNFVFILVILNLINILIRQLFRVFNSTSKILITNLIASVLAIVSIDYIIKSFGINGVYLGTIFSQISVILLSLWFLNKSNKLVHR